MSCFTQRDRILAAVVAALLCVGCQHSSRREVVLYTSLDQVYSQPILAEFERRSGLAIQAVYDVEAAKTVGLVNRLIAERSHPRADVFWNSEILQTVRLHRLGLLCPYKSPSAASIPRGYREPQGHWTGFAARARVIAFNTQQVARGECPRSLRELSRPQWRGRVALANPCFGTTSTHVAALFATWGAKRTKEFLTRLKKQGVRVVPGNSAVCDQIVAGSVWVGLTDTDDVWIRKLRGEPIDFVYPDQKNGGTLVIPNTVALIANCPHPVEGKRLIDFLLSEEVERRLAQCPSRQMPVRPAVPVPKDAVRLGDLRQLRVDYESLAVELGPAGRFVRETFLR